MNSLPLLLGVRWPPPASEEGLNDNQLNCAQSLFAKMLELERLAIELKAQANCQDASKQSNKECYKYLTVRQWHNLWFF
ncbi:hypothetical protein COCOBI_pt-2010 (chloroplast) [Coccomyxa sp. Obi]|nr:hypothetical protein COCOBI_pt-2010 [Coccomyxa sp. Obi]